MMRPLSLSFLFFFFSTLQAENTQIWTRGTFVHEINEIYSLTLMNVYRWNTGSEGLFEKYIQCNLDYHLSPSLEISPGYRYEKKREDRCWQRRDHILLDIKKTWTLSCWQLFNRCRLQYQFAHRTWRFRNLVMISYPLTVNKIHFSPFVQDEIFLKKLSDFIENRWEVGIEYPTKLGPIFSLSYLQKLHKKSGRWHCIDVCNLKLYLNF